MRTVVLLQPASPFASLVFAILLVCVRPLAGAAETIPGEVSDIIRDLGEMRDLSWGLLDEARKAHTTNESQLADLNVRYIEASAVANSLIEQFQLETAARTSMDVKRYQDSVSRTRQRYEAFQAEWDRLMRNPVKTRGGSSSDADNTLSQITKAVAITDGILASIMKNRKAFRDLDESQRVEVRKLLEARKWRPLSWNPPATPPAAESSEVSVSRKPGLDHQLGAAVSPSNAASSQTAVTNLNSKPAISP